MSGGCSTDELCLPRVSKQRISFQKALSVTGKRTAAAASGKCRAQEGSGGLCFVCVSVFNRREKAYFCIK